LTGRYRLRQEVRKMPPALIIAFLLDGIVSGAFEAMGAHRLGQGWDRASTAQDWQRRARAMPETNKFMIDINK
jgi:hypothetical protein